MLLWTLLLAVPTTDPDLPRTLAETWTPAEPQEPKDKLVWSVGVRVGYAAGFDSDEGGFLLGAQGRIHLKPWLAFEAVIEQHNEEYEDGDVDVRYTPVQASALFYPFPDPKLRPYGVVGVGFHNIAADYKGTLAPIDDERWMRFGFHIGAGLDLALGEHFVLNGDARFQFIDEPGDFDDDALDFWEIAVGISYVFK
jgi:opacity protein-like surface antigen